MFDVGARVFLAFLGVGADVRDFHEVLHEMHLKRSGQLISWLCYLMRYILPCLFIRESQL